MSTIKPPAILLEGAPGSGKTFSIPTLAKAGLEVFVIGTELGYVESLIDGARFHGAPMEKIHWRSVSPVAAGFSALQDMVRNIGSQGYEDLAKIKSGIGKDKTRQPAVDMLAAMENYKCERDGKEYGSIEKWDDSRVLVIDSLSGLSQIAWALTVGYKPAAHQGEWGVAMNFLEQLLMKLNAVPCFFVLTAHVEKEMNEITGTQQIMASTLGRKLAPKIPRFFSEVVLASRKKDGSRFSWSTIDNNADLKNRSLPISDNLNPDFAPVVSAYSERKKAATA